MKLQKVSPITENQEKGLYGFTVLHFLPFVKAMPFAYSSNLDLML